VRMALCVEFHTKSATKHVSVRRSIKRQAEAVQQKYCCTSN
jgi:hypothetical protein